MNSLEIIICPQKNVSIDESLIGYDGRGPAIQYMPNIHARYTAVPLAESLLLEGTNFTGTVCSNRKYLPAGVKK